MQKKYIWIGIIAVVVAAIGAVALFLFTESPVRVLNSGLDALKAHKADKFMQLVDKNLTKKQTLTMTDAIQDFISADTITTKVTSDEGWRADGDKIIPTRKYIASNYKAEVDLTLNQQPLHLVIRLQRTDTNDQLHYFSYLFKPWAIESVKVQKTKSK